MKLKIAGSKATGSAVDSASRFGVALNAKTFSVLSSTLYKDRYGAIIRELCSNAYDAHLMVDTPERPFRLVLPDAFDSYLVIRDFGPGISPKDIFEVYCVYFESTKDQCTRSLGAFGLGCKTPFSYTDTFTVTSIYEGVKRVYTAFKDEGLPNIVLMHEEPTDDESGLEIKIPVKSSDVSSFRDAVKRELRFFDVKPEVNASITWGNIGHTMKFGPVQFYETDDSTNLSGFFVRVGQVGYRIDYAIIKEYSVNKRVPLNVMGEHLFTMHSGRNLGAVLSVGVNDVEVQPSREGIHYTDETCANILKAVNESMNGVETEVLKIMVDAYGKSPYEFLEAYQNIPRFMIGAAAKVFGENADKFGDFHLNGLRSDMQYQWDQKIVGKSQVLQYKTGHRSKPELTSTESISVMRERYSHTGGATTLHRFDIVPWAVFGTRFFVKDESYAYLSRIMESDDYERGHFTVLDPDPAVPLDKLVQYLEQFGAKCILVSSLPKPTRAPRAKREKSSWFKVHDLMASKDSAGFAGFCYTMCRYTLYSLNCATVKNGELDDITVPTIVMRTHRNNLLLPEATEESLLEQIAIVQVLSRRGYEVIAIPANQKYDNENLVEIDDLSQTHKDTLESFLKEYRAERLMLAASLYISSLRDFCKNSPNGLFVSEEVRCETLELLHESGLKDERNNDFICLYRNTIPLLENYLGVESTATKFGTFAELFQSLDNLGHEAGKIDPVELLERVKSSFSAKNAIVFMAETGLRYFPSARICDERVDEEIELSVANMVLEFVKSLD